MKKLVPVLVVIGAMVVALGGARPAFAQDGDVKKVEILPQEDKKKDLPPDFAISVYNRTSIPEVDKIELVQTDAKGGEVKLKATEVKKFEDGPESIGIVLVIEAHHLFIGDGTEEVPGVFKKLGEAIDEFRKASKNTSSQAAIVAYGKGNEVRMPPGPLGSLSADKFGDVKMSEPHDTRDLVNGISKGHDLLQAMSVSRKVMVVIGDGVDASVDGPAQIKNWGGKLEQANIEVYAIYSAPPLIPEPNPNGFKSLTAADRVFSAKTIDALPAQASSIVTMLQNRFYLRFPGADVKLQKSFEWDTKPHEFVLRLDEAELELEAQALAPKWVPPWMRKSGGGFPWLAVIGGVLGVGLLIGIIAMVAKKKPAPEPVVMAPPPVVAAPPPGPSPAQKTVMINLGATTEGWPVVAWIVPLNGNNAYQTFKLSHSQTKIGSGATAHVRIDDGYMSTEHCSIVAAAGGFTLVDGGSTNGTYVNEKRVDKHELIDNDVIKMGSTTCKFKTIV